MNHSEVSPNKWQALQKRIVELVNSGQADAVEVLLAESIELRSQESLLLDCLSVEFRTRKNLGQLTDPDDYYRRFPDLAQKLRRLIEIRDAVQPVDELRSLPPCGDSIALTTDHKAAESDSLTDRLAETVHMPKDSTTSPLENRYVGDYEILEEIARGGMGVVYKARHRLLGRMAAVKLIKSGDLAEESEVQRFRVEAQAAADLDHSGIVSVFDFGQQDGQPFMALAYVEGQSLWQRVKEAPLPSREAARLMRLVAEAIQYAHHQGIIHRDLKPQNILLTKDGQPKVTDFGLAKKETGDSSLTGTGQVLGTPSYMPPEQVAGKNKATTTGPSSDLYSLGATLYCLLTGRPPFQAATPLETMLQVLNQEPASPRQLNQSIPKDLETICLKCLRKDPGQRYASAQALADDLGRYLAGEPILASPVSTMERAWRWCKRNPVVSGLSTATIVLLVSVVAVFIVSARREFRTLSISTYTTALENGLQQDDWTVDHVRELDELLGKLAHVDTAKAAAGHDRLNARFQADLNRRLHKPRISDADTAELTALLDVLAARDAKLATPMKSLLEQRHSAWQPLVELGDNWNDWESVFDTQSIRRDGNRLLAQTADTPVEKTGELFAAPRVLLTPESGPNVQFEAQFEAIGEDISDLGLELNVLGDSSYSFRVQRIGTQLSNGGIEDLKTERSALVQICRNGRVLREAELDDKSLFKHPVRLRVKRLMMLLSFQVNDATPIDVEDPFPLPTAQSGHFAIRWPPGAGVTKLIASRLTRATQPSPLEAADQLYAVGKIQEALSLYREQAALSGASNEGREARYKQAVCLLAQQREDEALTLWTQLSAETADKWTTLSEIQLWALLLEQKDADEANDMLLRLEVKYQFEDLARIVPDDLRQKIIDVFAQNLASRGGVSSETFLQSSPERLRKLIRARDCLRLLGSDNSQYEGVVIQLIYEQLFARNYQAAISESREIVRINPAYAACLTKALRAAGQHEEAIHFINEQLAKIDDQYRMSAFMQLEKLNSLAALKRWDEWGRLSADLLAANRSEFERLIVNQEPRSAYQLGGASVYCMVQLMRGFRLEELQHHEQANAAWQEAALGTREESPMLFYNSRMMHIARSFSGMDTRQNAEYGSTKIDSVGTHSLAKLATTIVGPELLTSISREMWLSPRGRIAAKQTVFDELIGPDENSIIPRLVGYEYLRQSIFERQMDSEQDELVWSLGLDLFDLATSGQELITPLSLGLALSWKGSTGVLGWQTATSNLLPELRAKLAYVFAYRYLKLGRQDDAATLFQAAIDAEPECLASKLSARDMAARMISK